MVSRGYASISYLYSVAEAINDQDKPCYLYHFGDHDPSGEDIRRAVEDRIREFAPDAEVYFEKIAVTPEQITEWGLPTRPTKKTDTRSRGFKGQSVDLDAIPAKKLRELVEDCITRHVDQRMYDKTLRIEEAERETLEGMVERLGAEIA